MASSSKANGAGHHKEEPDDELPPVHAAFLIKFDLRKGSVLTANVMYTWMQSLKVHAL